MKTGHGFVGILVVGWIASAQAAQAPVWQSETADLPETDIRLMAFAGKEGFLAASARHVYRRLPDNKGWKRVLGVRSPDEVVELLTDPRNAQVSWLASRRTLRRSPDGGRTWKVVFRRDSESGFQIRTAVLCEAASDCLLVGTTQGLFEFRLSGSFQPVEGAPKNASIDSILRTAAGWIVVSGRGVYKASVDFRDWELLEGDLRAEPIGEENPLEQFSVEEISLRPSAGAVVWPRDGRVFVAKADGVYENRPGRREAVRLPETAGFRVRRLAADERFVYLATDRGLYRLEPEAKSVENISQGLESLDVSAVMAEPAGGDVWVGTRKGVFRMSASDFPQPAPQLLIPGRTVEVPAPAFSNEPTIAEIQQAAVHYAEVSPDKIKAWREAAARKAWLPTVSFDTDFGRDLNVDIDRGGTNDPDRFIVGPEEKTLDWSVDFSWDLGDLIWNDDQTSIDVRSRLMVELRNDILSEVTHLYFERRRTQLELEALPADKPKLRIDKELKLAELTAQIDALTGGYLSRRLASN